MKHIISFLKTFKKENFLRSLERIETKAEFDSVYRVLKKLDTTGNTVAKAVRDFGKKRGFWEEKTTDLNFDSALNALQLEGDEDDA